MKVRVLIALPTLLVLGVIFLVVPLTVGTVALYTDWLWFEEVGYTSVFGTVLWTRAVLWLLSALLAFVVLYGNLRLIRRARRPVAGETATRALPFWSRIEPIYGRLSLAACAGAALILASEGVVDWSTAVGFWNRVAFDVADPLFGHDVGFYVFTYPLLLHVHGFLTLLGLLAFAAVVAVCIAAGGIGLGLPLTVRPYARNHLLGLAAALLGIKLWGYWLDAYGLLFSTGGAAYGASYTDVHASLPALRVVMGAAALAAVLCLVQMRRAGIGLAVSGLTLWGVASILGLTAYPMAVQRFRVAPSELASERPYIERTIAATNRAYGLDRIEQRPFPVHEDLTAVVLAKNETTIKNTRLWEQRPALESYAQLQEIRPYYKFVDVDADRYAIDGELRQVMLSVRELSQVHLPVQTWINEHLVYTHGYGAVVGPVNRASREGLPEFVVKDIPPVSAGSLRIRHPAVYYGEVASAYALVKTRQKEFDYPAGDRNEETTYAGDGGVRIGSLWRKLLFTLRLAEPKILFSQDLTSESRILYHRQIAERVQKIAPFLRLDRDVYPVITADGRIVWLLDAYTTAEHYPYSEPTTGVGNYIRNSVKVTVDAYHGTVRFYVVEPDEPLTRAWGRAFPEFFRPLAEMPADLRAHLRYPQDLFAIQARMYAVYHMREPQVFYNREDVWNLPARQSDAPAESLTRKTDRRSRRGGARPAAAPTDVEMAPYYTIMRLPGEPREEFVLLLPFTPVRRDNMIAWLAARSDPPHYGKLRLYEFPKGKLVFGPRQIEARIVQDADIAQQLSLWSQAGSQAMRGGLLAIPIEESLLYVQPLYLAAQTGRLPELKRVIAAYGERIAMEETLESSLQKIFGVNGHAAPSATPAAVTAPAPGGDRAARALEHFRQAQEHLGRWDWKGFGHELQKVEDILRELEQAEASRGRRAPRRTSAAP